MKRYLHCNERKPGISLALDIRNELTLDESAAAICSFADEVRRECANRAVAWQVKLCADDDWTCERCTECNQLRYAIMGKEAKE